jgi:hypothetical protein
MQLQRKPLNVGMAAKCQSRALVPLLQQMGRAQELIVLQAHSLTLELTDVKHWLQQPQVAL